jgi:hypothetical protein
VAAAISCVTALVVVLNAVGVDTLDAWCHLMIATAGEPVGTAISGLMILMSVDHSSSSVSSNLTSMIAASPKSSALILSRSRSYPGGSWTLI